MKCTKNSQAKDTTDPDEMYKDHKGERSCHRSKGHCEISMKLKWILVLKISYSCTNVKPDMLFLIEHAYSSTLLDFTVSVQYVPVHCKMFFKRIQILAILLIGVTEFCLMNIYNS